MPTSEMREETTQCLQRARAGDRAAFDRLFVLVYDELRGVAHRRLVRHRPGETLDTTALVHEVYLRLADQSQLDWNDRSHFLALASRAMRFTLVNYAEAKAAAKRGGGVADIALDAVQVAAREQAIELVALSEALDALAHQDERLASIVECRFFGGLTYEEIAAVTGLSVPTVKRDWVRARGWLYRFMRDGSDAEAHH